MSTDVRTALELIAAPMRPDGTWNRDREACRRLAVEALAQPSTDVRAALQPDGWLHLKSYGYAPGEYMGRCHKCGQTVTGIDKRAVTCRPCAEALAAEAPVSESWEGTEGWEALAWHLCAEENGEDACNELVWEGGPMPEPWGDRWLKYEGEAKRMIALVGRHAPPAPPNAEAPVSEPVALFSHGPWVFEETGQRFTGAELDAEAFTKYGAALRQAQAERDALKTVMIAAAEEIAAHWQAHCDADGYGPQNLMRRLEEGIPSEYGYTAGRFAELQAELSTLRQSHAALLAALEQMAELAVFQLGEPPPDGDGPLPQAIAAIKDARRVGATK